jgi:HEAT repeats
MQCEQVRERLTDLLTGEAGADLEALRQHLAACSGCRAEADELEQVWSALGAVPSPRPDSTAMSARFASMLDGYEQGRAGTAAARWDRMNGWLSTFWPRQPLMQLACGAALLVIGLAGGRATRPLAPPPSDEMAALRTELRETRQMVTLSLLQQQSASDRLRGVSFSGRLEEPGGEVVSALLDALLHDPNVNVRLASIDALVRFADQQAVRQGAIEALQSATSPLVQIALIDFVVGLQEKTSVEALKRLADDPALNEAVRSRVDWGLSQLGVKS